MTKKRFVNKGTDIFQYGEWYCSAGGEHCAEVITEALNILIEENEELKSDLEYWKTLGHGLSKRIGSSKHYF